MPEKKGVSLSQKAKRLTALEAYDEIHVDERGLGVRCEILDIGLLVFGALRLIMGISESPFLRFAFCSGHSLI